MSDYRVSVKVQNNNILKIIEKQGHESIASFCKEHGFSQSWLGRIVNMKITPFDKDGEVRKGVLRLLEILNIGIDQAFTENQMSASLESNKRKFEIEEAEVKHFLHRADNAKPIEHLVVEEEISKNIEFTLDTLPSRERKIIEKRFGLNGEEPMTLHDIGKEFNVGGQRIREIEASALRKMRHPTRSDRLREYVDEEYVYEPRKDM
jgi:RNA polymerase sigma factor (sigma-70 family)